MRKKNKKNKEWEDPIVAEIHAIREAHAKQFNYDADAMFQDLLEKQQAREALGHKFVTLPPKRIQKKKTGTDH